MLNRIANTKRTLKYILRRNNTDSSRVVGRHVDIVFLTQLIDSDQKQADLANCVGRRPAVVTYKQFYI